MASTSTPQQGNLPTEVMPQISNLDSNQVAQILRNLPGLLNKVRVDILPPTGFAFLVVGGAPGRCDLRVHFTSVALIEGGWNGIPITLTS